MSEIPFNINHIVSVKLTDFGKQKLIENHNSLLKTIHDNGVDISTFKDHDPLPKEDSDGWSKWQLWVLMEQLGIYCTFDELPFETNIKFEVKEYE